MTRLRRPSAHGPGDRRSFASGSRSDRVLPAAKTLLNKSGTCLLSSEEDTFAAYRMHVDKRFWKPYAHPLSHGQVRQPFTGSQQPALSSLAWYVLPTAAPSCSTYMFCTSEWASSVRRCSSPGCPHDGAYGYYASSPPRSGQAPIPALQDAALASIYRTHDPGGISPRGFLSQALCVQSCPLPGMPEDSERPRWRPPHPSIC